MDKRKRISIVVGFILIASIVNIAIMLRPNSRVFDIGKPTPTLVQAQANDFTYQGQAGKDALTLLRSHTTVAQNKSGLVTMINNRTANDTMHEFWAFYVNGKMASVGPAQYVTKNTDKIEWKIDHY